MPSDLPPPLYSNPNSIEPLLPDSNRAKMAELTCEIFREAGILHAEIPSMVTKAKIAALVREMNSYYSNLIEGHRTLPRDIGKALRKDYSNKPKERENQLLHHAHIQTQEAMEQKLSKEKINIYSSEFICWLHHEFYRHLPDDLHWSETKSGTRYRIYPGQIRNFDVSVGLHDPPLHSALPSFLERFDTGYNHPNILATTRLIVCAAAHHRLLWVHPFGDGNGRVCRLQTHACLIQENVDALGLWTVSRGLARDKKKYYEFLANADSPRVNDLDGRGNLSERGLALFCEFFLETILNQIKFMSSLLSVSNLAERMESYVHREALQLRRYRNEISSLLKAFLIEGDIPRGRVPEIICRNDSIATKIIKMVLIEDLAETPSPKGKLSIKFPVKILESYFPRLFLESLT